MPRGGGRRRRPHAQALPPSRSTLSQPPFVVHHTGPVRDEASFSSLWPAAPPGPAATGRTAEGARCPAASPRQQSGNTPGPNLRSNCLSHTAVLPAPRMPAWRGPPPVKGIRVAFHRKRRGEETPRRPIATATPSIVAWTTARYIAQIATGGEIDGDG